MEAWKRRTIRRAFSLTIKGMSIVAAVSAAVAEEATDEDDAEQKLRVMERWLRENAVATADGNWAIPHAVVEQMKEDSESE